MKLRVLSIVLIICFCSCDELTDPDHRRQDESAIRKILQLPDDAKLVSLNSYPIQSGGFFGRGREGLRITAVFELVPNDLQKYLDLTKVQNNWLPSPHTPTKPAPDEEYSDESLRWQPLPVPQFIKDSSKFGESQVREAFSATSGIYWCTVSLYLPSKGKYPYPEYFKRIACNENRGHAGWKLTLAILNTETRRVTVQYHE